MVYVYHHQQRIINTVAARLHSCNSVYQSNQTLSHVCQSVVTCNIFQDYTFKPIEAASEAASKEDYF